LAAPRRYAAREANRTKDLNLPCRNYTAVASRKLCVWCPSQAAQASATFRTLPAVIVIDALFECHFPFGFFPHLAAAAFCATSLRCAEVKALARAAPPARPPVRATS